MSSSTLSIYIVDENFREEVYQFIANSEDGRIYLTLLLFSVGMLQSIYHAFSNKKKTKFQKSNMLYFAMTLLLIIGFYTLIRSIENDEVRIVFPLLNFFQVVIMWILYDREYINEKNILDRNADLLEIVIATMILINVIYLNVFVLSNHWLVTLSVSLLIANQISSISHSTANSLLKYKAFV